MTNSTLVLVDGSSFLYRAFFAAKGNFTNKHGIPTGAMLLITRMIKNLVKSYEDHKIIVVFDAKGKSFRSDLYAEYKANRPPMPEDLSVQIPYIHEIIKALGLPIVQQSGVEADDILGSYAKQAVAQGFNVLIATGDKDLAQLVNDKVTLIDTMTNTVYDTKAVIDKFGIPPSLMIDFLALKGDKVDNIPGMPGTGDVTAKILLNSIGGLEDIKNNLDKIPALGFRGAKQFAKKFNDAIEQIELSYKLATIVQDLELPLPIESIKPPVANVEKLLQIYKEMGFTRLYNELIELTKKEDPLFLFAAIEDPQMLNQDSNKNAIEDEVKKEDAIFYKNKNRAEAYDPIGDIYSSDESDIATLKNLGVTFNCIFDKDELVALNDKIKKAGLVAIDTETTSLRASDATLIGISLCTDDKESFYIPLNHLEHGSKTKGRDARQLSVSDVKEVLGATLLDSSIKKIGHNIKYDLLVLDASGIEVHGVYFDTMLGFHFLKSSLRLSLDVLAKDFLGYSTILFEDVVGKGAHAMTFDKVAIDVATDYAAEDALITYKLYKKLEGKFTEGFDKDLYNLFFNQEMPLLNVLFKMERTGALVSGSELYNQNLVLNDEMLALEQEIYKGADEKFNISSPRQLSKVLFEKLAIPYPGKTKVSKTGETSYSTSEEILTEIAPKYDIANLILRYRTLNKLIVAYTDKLPNLISARTGRIHTNFNQAGTSTGRLSSSEPNLQNIPARTKEGRLIRKAFCAPQGFKILSADYSQIELRLIAHMSGDEGLIKAFLHHADIHRATAAEVLGISIDEVTDEQRSSAKATNFGLMYGMSAFGLSRQTKMPIPEAKDYIEKYFSRYPKVKEYMDVVVDGCKKLGYVSTLNGNKIFFDAILSGNNIAVAAAKRSAINAPMQGSAADIIKMAMIKIDEWISSLDSDEQKKIKMTLQVHDELVFEVANDFVDEAKEKIKDIMEHIATLKVPLEVGIGVADNWGDAH